MYRHNQNIRSMMHDLFGFVLTSFGLSDRYIRIDALASLPKLLMRQSVLHQFGIPMALCTLIFSPALGQEKADTPTSSSEETLPDLPEEGKETEQKPEPIDPRILRREETDRRNRIEVLSRTQSQLPKEAELLATPDIPKGLLPKRGVRSGSIVYLPSVSVGAIFTDNANGDDELLDEDVLVGVGAAVRAQTNLRRHQLGAEVSATTGYSVKGAEEDFLDWQAGIDGRFDFDRQNALKAGVGTTSAQEADSSAEADDNDDDATLNEIQGNIGYSLRGRTIDLSFDGLVDRQEFSGDDTDDRDNTTYTASTRVARKFGKRFSIFITPAYAYTKFDEEVSDDGQSRDAYEVSGLVGAEYRPRPRLSFGGALGYSQATFDDPDVDDNSSFIGSLGLDLAYDSKTDLGLTATRVLEITTVDGSASDITTTVSAKATRLLSTKQALVPKLTYRNTEFDGLDRIDQDIVANIDYFLRLTDHLVFNVGYQYLERFSDDANEEFRENQGRVSLTLVY